MPASPPASSAEGGIPRKSTMLFLLAVLCLVWGSTWLVIREGLRDVPPLTGAGLRFALAGVTMALLAPRLARREGGSRPPLSLTLVMALCNFAISYAIVYWAETVLASGLVSLLWSVFPLMMAGAGHAFIPGEQLRGKQWIGLLVGFAGVAFLFATDLANLGDGSLQAAAILLGSPLISAVGTTVVKRRGRHVSSVLLNRNGMLVGAVALLAAAFLFESKESVRWTGNAIFSIAYLSIMGTVVTFGIFFWLMRYAPAYQLSLIAYVVPVVALTLGATVGREDVTLSTVLGGLLILAGVALVLRGKQARIKRRST